MVQVAGRIVKHSGSIFLKLAVDIEKLELFKRIWANLTEVNIIIVKKLPLNLHWEDIFKFYIGIWDKNIDVS